MIRKIGLFPVVAVMLLCGGLFSWTIFALRPVQADPTTNETAIAPSPETTINLRRTTTVRVVQKTKDAVVNISARKLVDRHVTINGPFMQQFDTGQLVRVPADSLGSGFIVHPDGYVVTNNHVIDRAREISVELADGRKLPADLISADPDADLAVLRIHSTTPLPTLELGDSSDLMIGEPVIAVGNPLGFSHSVSTGIVAALHRDIEPRPPTENVDQPVHGEEAALRDLVQTDAAINPGNSGGPLLNVYGQVIGINTAIRSDAQNIGFAIPIDRLRDCIPELMNPSVVTKVDVPVKLLEKRTITEPATINATVVLAGNPPLVLDTINGQRPVNIIDAYAMLLKLKANEAVNVTWVGDEKPQKLITKATPIPDAIIQAKQRFGLVIEQVTPMLADKNQLKQEDGLYVDSVDPDGAAAKSGLQKGDVIVQVGPVRMMTLDDFGALLPRLPETGAVRVWVIRGPVMGHLTLRF